MRQHRYRITVEHISDAEGLPSSYDAPIQFEIGNHDDIHAIVQRLRERGDFSDSAAAAFGVGLKLFGEVMLEDKKNPLFASFKPHFGEFMKELKKGPAHGHSGL